MDYVRKLDAVLPSSRSVGLVAGALAVGLMLLTIGEAAREQIARFPPPPPSPADRAAALPRAASAWRVVAGRLQARFADQPLEVGEVWTRRDGRICGLVDARRSNTDDMERFFTTADLHPQLQRDDPWAFIAPWTACLDDRVVELHAGSEQTGLCASARGRSSVLGRAFLCVGWRPE